MTMFVLCQAAIRLLRLAKLTAPSLPVQSLFFSIPISPPKPVFGLEGHVRLPKQAKAGTEFSADIGMRGPRAPGAQWQFLFRVIFLWVNPV